MEGGGISFNHMVEQTTQLDSIFLALSDSTRRDMLRRVIVSPLSISDLAESYTMSFAAVAKHVSKLEAAHLVVKKRQGKQQIVLPVKVALNTATTYLEQYQKSWEKRFYALDELLNK